MITARSCFTNYRLDLHTRLLKRFLSVGRAIMVIVVVAALLQTVHRLTSHGRDDGMRNAHRAYIKPINGVRCAVGCCHILLNMAKWNSDFEQMQLHTTVVIVGSCRFWLASRRRFGRHFFTFEMASGVLQGV